MTTILVTGGAGYIGSHTSAQLVDAGYSVVVLDNLYTGHAWAVPKSATFVEGDVGDTPLVRQLLKRYHVQAVLHFAGYTVVPESVAEPLRYYANNTCATRNLIESCVAEGVGQFVFSSTAAVYGATSAEPVAETTEPHPINPYGRSKLMSEWILQDVAATGKLRFVALRYFNVAGAKLDASLGQATANATHLIKVACEAAAGKRSKIDIYGTDFPTPDGTGVRDYIHVEDLARAHIDALRYLDKNGSSEILNCGYGRGFSVREVLKAVEAASGKKIATRDMPRRPGDPAAVVADSRRIRSVLGWSPQFDDLPTICKTAYAWETKP